MKLKKPKKTTYASAILVVLIIRNRKKPPTPLTAMSSNTYSPTTSGEKLRGLCLINNVIIADSPFKHNIPKK